MWWWWTVKARRNTQHLNEWMKICRAWHLSVSPWYSHCHTLVLCETPGLQYRVRQEIQTNLSLWLSVMHLFEKADCGLA